MLCLKQGLREISAETPLAGVTQFGSTDLLWHCRHLLPPAVQQLGWLPHLWKGG